MTSLLPPRNQHPAGSGRLKVVMEWPLPSDIAIGEYTLRLMADMAGDSQPDDKRQSIPVTVRGEYADDELIKIAVQPNPAFLGEEVNVSVSVYNPTGTPLSIPLSLETNGFQFSSNVRNPLVQPEQWATREFVWRTGNQSPGTFSVTASADLVNTRGTKSAQPTASQPRQNP